VTGEESIDQTLGLIEGVNGLADSMDAMKRALEERGWSTPMSERVGADFGGVLFAMIGSAQSPSKPPGGKKQ
jgi:hypothetical protein